MMELQVMHMEIIKQNYKEKLKSVFVLYESRRNRKENNWR